MKKLRIAHFDLMVTPLKWTDSFRRVYKNKWGSGLTFYTLVKVLSSLCKTTKECRENFDVEGYGYFRWEPYECVYVLKNKFSKHLLSIEPKKLRAIAAKGTDLTILEMYITKLRKKQDKKTEALRQKEEAEAKAERFTRATTKAQRAEGQAQREAKAKKQRFAELNEYLAAKQEAEKQFLKEQQAIQAEYRHWDALGYMNIPFKAFAAMTVIERSQLIARLDKAHKKSEASRIRTEKALERRRKLNPDKLYTMLKRWKDPHERHLKDGKVIEVTGHFAHYIATVIE